MTRRRTLIGICLLAAAVAVAAIACDDKKETSKATATLPAGETPTAAAATDTPEATAEGPTDEAPTVIGTEHAELGLIITDISGRTLYVFANDAPGVSNCADACASLWPPFTVESGAEVSGGGVGTIERADGTTQVTYTDSPLYYFSNDTAPGDANGEGFAGLWSVIRLGG